VGRIVKRPSLCPIVALLLCHSFLTAKPETVQPLIRVDQIGYRPDLPKYAVLADPQEGWNAEQSYTPGDTLEVRRSADDQVVFTGPVKVWNDGKVDRTAGDRGWWFEFSEVHEPGDYYLWDPKNEVGSYPFRIALEVYRPILKAALKTFYYQRLAFPKEEPYAGADWTDGPAFVGKNQDTEARYYLDPLNAETERDLRGGWMDAGDYNKYVTFAAEPVHELLTAWERNPLAFDDALGIPESGNGVPDVLDEVAFEMEWVRRMQVEDGGVIIKMGAVTHNSQTPPSSDPEPRYYGPVCSSSTIAAAGMMAHAALRLRGYPMYQDFADDLEECALRAWEWYHANPRRTDCDDGTIKAGDADRSLAHQDSAAVIAAIYLFALTGEASFDAYACEHLEESIAFTDNRWSMYNPAHGDALIFYAQWPDADPITAAVIRKRKEVGGRELPWYRMHETESLYRAWMPDEQYHWGSVMPIAGIGSTSWDFIVTGWDKDNHERYRDRALGMLHYFHGVNPMGIVYLTNCYEQGAEECVDQIYHYWFRHGSKWDTNPPPGYLPGGPNRSYSGPVEALQDQPIEKMYLEFNEAWPEASWEISENAIYYQSAYIKLLSGFVR